MKKFVSVLMVAILSLSLVACSNSGNNGSSTTTSEAPASSENTTGEEKLRIAYIVGTLGDKSFNDSGERGMNELRSEGYDVKTIEAGQDSSKYRDYIDDAIDNGYNLIVASSTYYDAMKAAAIDNPEVKFLEFDDSKTAEELEPNMATLFYAQNEGSYLVGMLAAAMTESNTVAVDVGMNNPVINDFVTGYVQGVRDYAATLGKTVNVVTAPVGSWTDPATMKQIVLDQARNNNADVFFQVAGGSGDGLIEGCHELGAWAIGVDSDQYQAFKDSENPELADVILTSMLKEVGNSLVAMVKKIEAGEDVWKKTSTLGLSDNAVGYVDNDFFKANVPEDVRTAMAETAAKVKDGSLTIKSYFDFATEDEYNAFLTGE